MEQPSETLLPPIRSLVVFNSPQPFLALPRRQGLSYHSLSPLLLDLVFRPQRRPCPFLMHLWDAGSIICPSTSLLGPLSWLLGWCYTPQLSCLPLSLFPPAYPAQFSTAQLAACPPRAMPGSPPPVSRGLAAPPLGKGACRLRVRAFPGVFHGPRLAPAALHTLWWPALPVFGIWDGPNGGRAAGILLLAGLPEWTAYRGAPGDCRVPWTWMGIAGGPTGGQFGSLFFLLAGQCLGLTEGSNRTPALLHYSGWSMSQPTHTAKDNCWFCPFLGEIFVLWNIQSDFLGAPHQCTCFTPGQIHATTKHIGKCTMNSVPLSKSDVHSFTVPWRNQDPPDIL